MSLISGMHQIESFIHHFESTDNQSDSFNSRERTNEWMQTI